MLSPPMPRGRSFGGRAKEGGWGRGGGPQRTTGSRQSVSGQPRDGVRYNSLSSRPAVKDLGITCDQTRGLPRTCGEPMCVGPASRPQIPAAWHAWSYSRPELKSSPFSDGDDPDKGPQSTARGASVPATPRGAGPMARSALAPPVGTPCCSEGHCPVTLPQGL